MGMDDDQRAELLAAAREAAARARARHSGFRVGAAVLDDAGHLHPGCNVESDSYGLTICAERVAIFAALAAGARELVALAVSVPADRGPFAPLRANWTAEEDEPGTAGRMPCGACRQIMIEYLAPEAVVLVDGVGEFRAGELLPDAFRLPGRDTVTRRGDAETRRRGEGR